MKTRENLVRLKRFQVNEKRRQLAQLELMVADFDRMANELDAQILAEERKAGITDVNHFAYPTFAKAARQRRFHAALLLQHVGLGVAEVVAALAEADAELAKAEALENRDLRQREPEPDTRRAMIG